MLDIPLKIKTATTASNQKAYNIAEKLGYSKSAWCQKLRIGKFNSKELEDIADAIGAKLEITFVFPDGTRI